MSIALEKLIALALAEVGTCEEGGNNCGKEIREYQQATWLAPGAWAWCAALQCWLLREWLKDPQVLFELQLPPGSADAWRCKDASAFGWESWARIKGLQVLPETAKAKAGDIVIFDFSHIGIVVADQNGTEPIHTVEGNTNNKGARDSDSGDGVWRKTRERSLVKCYIRMIP